MASGTFEDFLLQVPQELIRLLMIFVILILMSLLGYILVKRREFRKRNETRQAQMNPTQAGLAASTPAVMGDEPDLDMLLAMTEPEAASPPVAQPANTTRQPGFVTMQMASGVAVEAAEVLILARDRATNRLIVQIGDHAYSGAEPQIDPAFRREFVGLMKELSSIAPQLGRGAKRAQRSQAAPATAQPIVPPSPSPVTGTLAGQIEARLQAKLRMTGAFPGRIIHVTDAPNDGVSIEVDGAVYDGVNAIADPEVRAFIVGVVAEWQESQ